MFFINYIVPSVMPLQCHKGLLYATGGEITIGNCPLLQVIIALFPHDQITKFSGSGKGLLSRTLISLLWYTTELAGTL